MFGLRYVNGCVGATEQCTDRALLDSSFDHPHILAGQGSLGLEILDQVPDVDAIVIPTGTRIFLVVSTA